ncbi:MAG TPA: hypothetical protein VHM30_11475 [Gemmatimonadaceae bacterium]|nr:hypothetical protein [Gemmatimonadaceae bacterium]
MSPRTWTRVGSAALVALVAACADSTSPNSRVTDAMMTRDAASDAGEAASLDVAQMATGEADAGLPSLVAAQSSSTTCTYSAATGRFACPTITTAEGLTLNRSYAYYGGGAAQSAYSATTTDSINFQWTLKGTLQGAGRTAWLDHNRSLTVSGLAGAETQRSWSGSGVRTDSSVATADGRTRRSKLIATSTVNQVVFKLPRSTYPYPQSGSITHDVTVTSAFEGAAGSTTRTGTRHVVVTFNGTRTASVVIGSTSCTLDLPTRVVSCP